MRSSGCTISVDRTPPVTPATKCCHRTWSNKENSKPAWLLDIAIYAWNERLALTGIRKFKSQQVRTFCNGSTSNYENALPSDKQTRDHLHSNKIFHGLQTNVMPHQKHLRDVNTQTPSTLSPTNAPITYTPQFMKNQPGAPGDPLLDLESRLLMTP